jgi:serine/threonine protein kinase
MRARFEREIEALGSLRHPNIVTVHATETIDQQPVLVMEWVDGQPVDRWAGRSAAEPPGSGPEQPRRSVPEILETFVGACDAVHHAHLHGVIHRDLKPSNLLIDTRGCARVADFGLARGPTTVGDLSLSGQVMGTAYYMAPEQAEDPRLVDTRADIYSFGATFYHALTGRPPFEGETFFTILYKHKTEPLISPRARRPDLSERVSELLERCLAKAPSDRFSSFADILGHLQPTTPAFSPWAASEDAELARYLRRYRERREAYLSERRLWNKELDFYTFPRGQVLRILRGDIVAQRVDTLVSSDTSSLRMEWGVSAAIRGAAGPEVAQQARHQAPVRPGRAAVTLAGNLPARLVFHGVTVGIVQDVVVTPSRDLIAEIMASCFYHADTYNVRSIAFPLLGTGAQRFPRDICLDTMFQFLARMFLRGLTPVQDARIVLFDADRPY